MLRCRAPNCRQALLSSSRSSCKLSRCAVAERTPGVLHDGLVTLPAKAKEKLLNSLINGHHQPSAALPADAGAASRDGTPTASTSGHHHRSSSSKHQGQVPAAGGARLSVRSAAAASPATPGASADAAGLVPAAAAAVALPVGGDKDLHDEIKGCEGWQDVLDVVEDEVPGMSTRSAVHALTRLNMLTKSAQPEERTALLASPAFQALALLVQAQVPTMNNVQLSNSLFAFAQLRMPVPEETLLAIYARTSDVIANFYPRDLSTILSAFAQLGAKPPRELLDLLGFRSQTLLGLHQFEPQGISMLLHSCVQLGYTNRILGAAAAEQARTYLARFSPQSVANTVWALARMGVYDQSLVEESLKFYASRPEQFKPQESANLLWAMTAFRHHPQAAFSPLVQGLLSPAPGQSLRPADIATTLYALAYFNVNPGRQLLGVLCKRVRAQLSECNAVELCSLYWGLGLLGEVEEQAYGEVEGALAQLHAKHPLNESLLRMAFQGFLAAKVAGTERQHVVPKAMLDDMKRAWMGAVAKKPPAKGESDGVSWVAGMLDELKVRYDARRPTSDGLALVDIALRAPNDRFVALQLAGTEDVCANGKQLLGPVQLQKAVLEKNGWDVKHVLLRDLEGFAPEMRPLFLAERLRGLGIRASAVPKESVAALKALATANDKGGAAAGGGAAGSGAAATGSGAGASRARQQQAAGEEQGHDAGRSSTGSSSSSAGGSKRRESRQQQHRHDEDDTDVLMRTTPGARPGPRRMRK